MPTCGFERRLQIFQKHGKEKTTGSAQKYSHVAFWIVISNHPRPWFPQPARLIKRAFAGSRFLRFLFFSLDSDSPRVNPSQTSDLPGGVSCMTRPREEGWAVGRLNEPKETAFWV